MNDGKAEQLTKRVDFAEKDDDEQIAHGVVMVPDAVDLQRDYVRAETIETFAEQFETFVEAGEAGGGVMHAVWPSEHISLERNEVLDEPTEIGGETVESGAWVQEWRFEDAELWDLVSDGVLEGYSIGAVDVQWGGPYEQDELDDVSVPGRIDDDELIWELEDGLIREVSAVDIPAVPDAMILETKADAEKRLGDHLGNRDAFIEEALERGHDEDAAERLWEYLNRAVDAEGAGEPGKDSMFARAGKAFLSALSGSDDDSQSSKTSEAPDTAESAGRDKEGKTLSRANEHSLYATIDASLDILQDAGVDHGMTRFTDRESTDFDLSDHSAREWTQPDDEDSPADSAGTSGPPFESATGGETPDDDTQMSDDNTDADDPMADAPEWAKALHEQTEKNAERIDDALDKADDEDDEDAEGEDDEDKSADEPPAWAKELQEQAEKNADRIDEISKQTGTASQQLGKGAEESEKSTGFTLDPRKAKR